MMASVDAEDPSPAGGTGAHGGAALCAWDVAIPLVTNRFMLWDLAKVWSISGLFLLAVIGVIVMRGPGPRPWGLVLGIPFFVSLGLFVLSLVVCVLFFFNRYLARFELRAGGAWFQSVRWTRKLTRAVNTGDLVLGILAARPQVAAAGLLAEVQKDLFVPWGDVRKVTVFAGPRVITLSNSWRPLLRLHCPTAEVFDAALAAVREQVPRHGGRLRRG
jgi:hypothetical protein